MIIITLLYLFLCKGNLTEVAPRPDLSRYTLFWLYNGSSTDNPTEISTASKGFLTKDKTTL